MRRGGAYTARVALVGPLALLAATSNVSLHAPPPPLLGAPLSVLRGRAFKAFVDTADPGAGLRVVRENIRRMQQRHQEHTTEYLHALINLALAHYNRSDFVLAWQCAEEAHRKVVATRGAHAVVAYFSATTAARCARRLREEYEAHIRARDAASMGVPLGHGLGAPRAKYHSPEVWIAELTKEERAYTALAQRLFWRPDNAFMRSDAEQQRGAAHWADHGTEGRSGEGAGGASDDAGVGGPRQQRQDEQRREQERRDARRRGYSATMRRQDQNDRDASDPR